MNRPKAIVQRTPIERWVTRLKRVRGVLIKAAVAESWKGAGHPSDAALLEEQLNAAWVKMHATIGDIDAAVDADRKEWLARKIEEFYDQQPTTDKDSVYCTTQDMTGWVFEDFAKFLDIKVNVPKGKA